MMSTWQPCLLTSRMRRLKNRRKRRRGRVRWEVEVEPPRIYRAGKELKANVVAKKQQSTRIRLSYS